MNAYVSVCPLPLWSELRYIKRQRHVDRYVWIWNSIKILKIVQMKHIRTGRITINRNDLKQKETQC